MNADAEVLKGDDGDPANSMFQRCPCEGMHVLILQRFYLETLYFGEC